MRGNDRSGTRTPFSRGRRTSFKFWAKKQTARTDGLDPRPREHMFGVVDLPQQLSTPTPQLTRFIESEWLPTSEQPTTQRPIRQLQKQRRLGEEEVLQLVTDYLYGQGVMQLTRSYRINSSTVIGHLQRRGGACRTQRSPTYQTASCRSCPALR